MKINGHETSLMWLPEAGGCFVTVPWEKYAVRFGELPLGTEIEVIGYHYTEAELEAKCAQAKREAEHRRP